MRFALFHFALLAAVSVTATTLIARQSLPTCAVPCLSSTNSTSCAPNDDSCLCKDQGFINATTACIESSCTGSDLQNAEAFAQQLCLAVGVTLTASSATPTSTASSASAASPSSTASSSSGAQMTSTIGVFTGAVVALAIGAVL